MALDDNFVGTDAETLPDADLDFSCKSEPQQVHPEVVVDVKQDTTPERAEGLQGEDGPASEMWVRLPVTQVELWVNKDGPADISRTAKVKFPMEWGSHSTAQYVNGFQSQNNLNEQNDPYDECRIFFYDHEIDEWVISHYGYVGGCGPANDTGIGKFWVYDAADLMKGIQVSKSFGEPSLSQVVDFVINGIDNQGNPVGLEGRSVFDNVKISILGEQGIPSKKKSDLQEEDTQNFRLPVIGKVPDFIDDIFNIVEDTLVDELLGAQKRFQINRHNMVDYMEWFTSLIDARWWFEPSTDGPALVVDATAFKSGQGKGNYERRYFVDDEAVDDWKEVQGKARAEAATEQLAISEKELNTDIRTYGDETVVPPNSETIDLSDADTPDAPVDDTVVTKEDIPDDFLPPHNYDIFSNVDILQNDALVDIKPFNTLALYGESTTFRERYGHSGRGELGDDREASTQQNFREAASAGAYTQEYPYVKATYEPLLDRTGGYEYSAQPIESDKVYLEEARSQAKKEFRKHLAEETEGQLTLYGEPSIIPFDYIVALPVCDGTYIDADAEPITWEVNAVKHMRKAGEQYKTELGASMTVEDRHFDITAEYREA